VQPRKSGRGCLIALGVVGVVLVVIGVLIAVAIWKFASTVEDVADGITVGDVKCPTEEKVSDIVGHTVELSSSGNIIVASGCNYTSRGETAGVAIVSGAGLISEEVIAELESEAQTNGTEATSIDGGDGGKAFGSPMRSEAATEADGHIVEVDIFAEGTDPIGDKRDEAVEILELYVDLND